MDRFSTQDRDGDTFVLRVPTREDLRCLQLRENEVCAGALGTPLQLPDEGVGSLEGVFTAPVWMLRSRDCGTRECMCQLVDLSLVIHGIPPQARTSAIMAHLSVMNDLNSHMRATTLVAAGIDELGDVCVECLSDPENHLQNLDNELVERAREFAAATALCSLEIKVK